MSEIESLVRAYEDMVSLPWESNLAGPQKVWFAVYEPAQERRLRLRISEFESATKRAGHQWVMVDLTNTFPEWMSNHEYRDAYFEKPDLLKLALKDYAQFIADRVAETLTAANAGKNTVVAVLGLGTLYGLTFASALFQQVAPAIQGRLLAFFPGRYEESNYRLLDARDGWNYLAVPITPKDWGNKK